MPVSADTLRVLLEAGLSGETLLRAVAAIDADMAMIAPSFDPAAEKRRAYDRQRKADAAAAAKSISTGIPPERTASVPNHISTGNSTGIPPETSFSPTPSSLTSEPREEKKEVSSLRSENATCANGHTQIDDWPKDFREQFWRAYPHKVGKGDAMKALETARKSRIVTFVDLMAGLGRYVAKTDDRPWCNPATWIRQQRWTDEPGLPPPARAGPASPSLFGRPPPVSNDEILAEIRRRNEQRSNQH